MDDLSTVTAKERLALLNREIEMCENERDNLLYEYSLLKDNARRMKKRAIPRLLIVCIYLIINRGLRIRQLIELNSHVPGESWMSPPPTLFERYEPLFADPIALFFLFIIFSIYGIVLVLRFYAMFAKTEHSVAPIKIADIMNVRNYNMELTSTEDKIRKCDLELQNLKNESDQVLFDIINQPPSGN